MSADRCERCKRGYGGVPPKDDVEWVLGPSETPAAGTKHLRMGRCTRCSCWLVDLWSTDRDRPELQVHDVGVVLHDAARAALLDRAPLALAALSSQLRRRHLEELVAGMPTGERGALERIEAGTVEGCSEVFRGLVTRAHAVSSELPPIGDVRPRPLGLKRSSGGVGIRAPLDIGDGSRALLEPARDGGGLQLSRVRGDAVLWRTDLGTNAKDALVARVGGRDDANLLVLAGPTNANTEGEVFFVDSETGTVRARGPHTLRVAVFDAVALPGGCTFIASYQSCAILRDDATVAWHASAAAHPGVVPLEGGAVVVDAPWRLLALALPTGAERWSMPVDRAATIAPSEPGHLLLSSGDVVSRLDVAGPKPKLLWIAQGASVLPLVSGGAAVVRERWEKSGRKVECVVIDPRGRRRFSVSRPDATKVPRAELAPGVLLYYGSSDVAVTTGETVSYALALPEGRQVFVTVEEGGAWIEYDGVVDKVDQSGKRVGRWRVG